MGRNWTTPTTRKRNEMMKTERGIHMYGNPHAGECEMRTERQVGEKSRHWVGTPWWPERDESARKEESTVVST